ncbi:hypothetical protein CsSME_00053075 [Camellia sinensis var. sinensis]
MGDKVNPRGSDSVEVNDCSRGDYPPLVVDLSDNSASDCAAVEEIRVPTRRSLRNQEVLGTLISNRIDRTANNTGKNMPWKRRRNPILEETAVTEGASFFEEPPAWSKHNAETTDFEEAKALKMANSVEILATKSVKLQNDPIEKETLFSVNLRLTKRIPFKMTLVGSMRMI